eukprot:NODE_15_length_50561_cov_0.608081.p2 type:complete len:1139 gc:universal NODE_15_length_50561_cov_0.608081:12744-9328(-)
MSAKAIREIDGKSLISYHLHRSHIQLNNDFKIDHIQDQEQVSFRFLTGNLSQVTNNQLSQQLPIHLQYVVKPDMLIKRRGKLGLIGLNKKVDECLDWIRGHPTTQIGSLTGPLTHFIIEPFIPHKLEYYICISSDRQGDTIYFHHEGGVDIGDVEEKAIKVDVFALETLKATDISKLLANVPSAHKVVLTEFISRLYAVYVDLHFTYLEINPLVLLEQSEISNNPQLKAILDTNGGNVKPYTISMMDLAAKLDQTAEFETGDKIQQALSASIEYPAPFGRVLSKEEAFIQELDAKTGASLKLTILNPHGQVWTMVAGGGASVAYADAIANYGFANELANYGEYSGAPSTEQTYLYAKTILQLMTKYEHKDGKILLIGGGIANFTNVASTFKGIIKALQEFQIQLQQHKTRIFVRRAGPNYQEGLQNIKRVASELNLDMHVYGPETHVTSIVPMALKGDVKEEWTEQAKAKPTSTPRGPTNSSIERVTTPPPSASFSPTFTNSTRCFIWGMQPKAVQGMLDFDYMCKRQTPSVAAMIYPFGGDSNMKYYWGTQDIMIPVYDSLLKALEAHPEVNSIINFTSCRSVFSSTMDIMNFNQIKTICIIAEGVPERRTRHLLHVAKAKNVLIIGPATVGGIKPGCFKIGNTGGMMDNIVSSKLYRPGSVAYVSKSGGMSNELNNMISLHTNGVYEGIAIGGDRYPGSTLLDHILRYEQDPHVKLIVLLGEVGGKEEYRVMEAVKSKTITKPIVGWCIGTVADLLTTDVQFGHAGAHANNKEETANYKNQKMKESGISVPNTFEELPDLLSEVYNKLVENGTIHVMKEPEVPKIPIDYAWAQQLGLIRKPANFISTITDDRGEELLYAGMPISQVFNQNLGVGGVVSLLWFKRRLPEYACHFIEMVLMLTADHGPAVSGAHNTIVTARAGKDLISSVVSGMLTIGERFGGALDGAALLFSQAYDSNKTPRQFVDEMRKENKLILGIGHKIKSKTNPDMRVELVKNYAKSHFPATPILDYALKVEEITTQKKDNLILNVDGAIGVLFVDLLRHSGAFSKEEAEEYIKIGTLNGLFVLGRTIGFTAHYLDQKRLKQGLYRHPVLFYLFSGTTLVILLKVSKESMLILIVSRKKEQVSNKILNLLTLI